MSPRKEITLSLPVWSPGSYMVRDYSRHIHKLEVSALGKNRKRPEVSQIDLDSWSVLCEGTPFLIRYVVYGYDYSVRSNYFTTEFCLLHPPALFLYPKDEKVSEITLEISNSLPFEFCHSGLDGKGKNVFPKIWTNSWMLPFFYPTAQPFRFMWENVFTKSYSKENYPNLFRKP